MGEELEAVDNYIYILNVRFAGDIHFSKEVDESLENVRMPSMILQPVVENAVNHGIRDIEWEGKIHLTVTGDADYIRISVKIMEGNDAGTDRGCSVRKQRAQK